MKPFTCMIVDDEPLAVRLLESYVEKTPDLQLLASYTDSITAINAIKKQKPDLLFLDIQMPNIDGMELAHSLPEQTRVVFTTAFKEYAFESYEVNALDFLLKPIRYNKFLGSIEKAIKWFDTQQTAVQPKQQPNTIFVRVDGEWRNISIDQITYVNGMKDYVMFYLDGEKKPLVSHLTMKAVEDMLPTDKFLRIHRSYIVAVDKIQKVDRNDCVYIGDEIIHIPDGYLQTFRNFLETRSFPK
ncbi:MAG: response regulator transcription factor [Prevotella sp.]|nr:response regulator transcription factor [Prevotella sp.]